MSGQDADRQYAEELAPGDVDEDAVRAMWDAVREGRIGTATNFPGPQAPLSPGWWRAGSAGHRTMLDVIHEVPGDLPALGPRGQVVALTAYLDANPSYLDAIPAYIHDDLARFLRGGGLPTTPGAAGHTLVRTPPPGR